MELTIQDFSIEEALHSPQYVQVRRRVFRQCIESLLYEGILIPETLQEGDETIYTLHGFDEGELPVRYLCRGRKSASFGLVRLGKDPVTRVVYDQNGVEKQESEAVSLTRFLVEVFRTNTVDEQRLKLFANDLEQTLLKDTLSQYYRIQNDIRMQGKSYDELEGDLMDGHPYHPSYKSRVGFTYVDHFAYGPEFKQEVHFLWLAIHKQYSQVSIDQGRNFDDLLLDEIGREQKEAFQQIIVNHGCDPDQYAFVPVHPWQWRNHIVPGFQDDIHRKQIIVLGAGSDGHRPQQSIRTFANKSNPHKPYLKLSMNVVNTSAPRHLTPHSLASAPIVSRWLKGITDADAYLRDVQKVIMLQEFAAVAYDPPPASELVEMVTFGVIGCMWRESLIPHLEAGEEAVPYNALAAVEVDGMPFIDPWVRKQGLENWLVRLLESSVLPVVHILVKHGIAMETHAQNMVLVHRDGVPTRVALKDFHEDLIFCQPFLSEPDKCPNFAEVHEYYATKPDDVMFHMNQTSTVRDLTLETLFMINLGQLARLLEEHYSYAEENFWEMAVQVLEGHQQRFPELAERFKRFDLFVPIVQVEKLTKKKLYTTNENYHLHEVPNPLFEARKRLHSMAVGGY
ncbi:IucA/IucC family protein [Brevibacillus brevis]|uniref:IucA/IucC family protein n=1 Tax=Brevibacillus brevis TaxID=1393 RepID=UPI001EDA4412|nr:IucA/IucC family protein [Brevibacillus brevis]UKK97856.1 siderophore biosynthesis protein [Brevibacillus brevis]